MPELPCVLLVEDDEIDVEAIERAFHKHGVKNPLIVARDGVHALSLLRGDTGRPVPRPGVVLLDLHMPRMSGHEFLEQLRSDPGLHDAVVFVLTTSTSVEDRNSAYDRNVAGYIAKSDVGRRYEGLIQLLRTYLDVVTLPT